MLSHARRRGGQTIIFIKVGLAATGRSAVKSRWWESLLPDSLKSCVSSLVKGILFGIGFTAAVYAVSYYIAHGVKRPLAVIIGEDILSDKEGNIPADYRQDLAIVSYFSFKERKAAGHFNILGRIKNSGATTWNGIEIQAELFEDGRYVDECQGHVATLHPGEEDNFKIMCGECDQSEPSPHDKIVLKVGAAYREPR